MAESDSTLGNHAARGGGISAYCRTPGCLGSLTLHLPTLVWTRGLDFPIGRLRERLRCPRCGSRNVRIEVTRWTHVGYPEPVPLTDRDRHRQPKQDRR